MLAIACTLLAHCLTVLVSACLSRLEPPRPSSISKKACGCILVSPQCLDFANILGEATRLRQLECQHQASSKIIPSHLTTDDPLPSRRLERALVPTKGTAAGHRRMTRLPLALTLRLHFKGPSVES